MLSGLAGLTAIASSDSFRCRWLISILAGVAVAARGPVRAVASAAGAAASAAPVTIATTIIGNRKRYIADLPLLIRSADGSAGITSGVEMRVTPCAGQQRVVHWPASLSRACLSEGV